MKALVTGATGFIGRRLLPRLERRVVLTRNPDKARASLREFNADIFGCNLEKEPPPKEAFDGVDTVFHLAGDSVADGRWTKAKKKLLRDSRITGTRNLVATLLSLPKPPKTLISASAVGYYSDRGIETLTEKSGPVKDFLGELCLDWETESHAASKAGIRVVNPRIGIVLGQGGGALAKMLPPFWFWMGAPLGNGLQYMPWIHIDDLVDMMIFAVENEGIQGAMNGVAPNPVTNTEFTKVLRKVLGVGTLSPLNVPYLGMRMLFGEFAKILLHSQKILPKVALDAGFQFQYPTLESALRAILRPVKAA